MPSDRKERMDLVAEGLTKQLEWLVADGKITLQEYNEQLDKLAGSEIETKRYYDDGKYRDEMIRSQARIEALLEVLVSEQIAINSKLRRSRSKSDYTKRNDEVIELFMRNYQHMMDATTYEEEVDTAQQQQLKELLAFLKEKQESKKELETNEEIKKRNRKK